MAVSFLADAELHGLVDGRLEADRRADLLRRLAASPTDRATVESWQAQTDLIRDTFRDVAQEPLPVALDLAPPQLRRVDFDRTPTARTSRPPRRTAGGGAAMTAALLITIGLTLSWMAGSRDDSTATASAARTTVTTDAGLPSIRIPDLSASGLRLTSVSSVPGDAARLTLLYQDAGAGRVAIEAMRNGPDIGPIPVSQAGKSLTWRSQAAAFTLAGTLPPARLRAIADSLQADQGSD